MSVFNRISLLAIICVTTLAGSPISWASAQNSMQSTRVRAQAAEEGRASHDSSQNLKKARAKRTAALRKSSAGSRRSKKTTAKQGPKLGTDFSFDAAAVRGKYQYADEGVVTVEDEKELVDFLGVRKHFKDRLADETNRQ